MPRPRKRRSRGLGSSDFAHNSMAGQKLLDVESALSNVKPSSSCDTKMVVLERALFDYGEAHGHMRSTKNPHLARKYAELGKRITELSGKVQRCVR
jgi:hypothetical protein